MYINVCEYMYICATIIKKKSNLDGVGGNEMGWKEERHRKMMKLYLQLK